MTKHRRGPWSQAEDQYLTQLVHSQGAHNWVRISQLINSRSPKQCRERYHQNLKPSLNLSPITPEEGAMIERMVAEMGKRWAEIARRLNGRSDNAVKNWWNGGMNRRKRLDNRRDAATRGPSNNSTNNNINSKPARPPYDAMPAATAMAHTSTFQQPFSVDPHHPHARLQPLPPPIITTNAKSMQPQQRRFVDTPVPSPSTVSNISRNDSVDGPPSMISDMSSYSTQPQSPHTPYTMNGVELPPLPGATNERSNSMASASSHMYHHYNNGWAFHGHAAPDAKAAMDSQYQQAYYGYTADEQMKSRMPMLPSQARPYEQLPLPSFRTVTAPDVRVAGPPSPHRDSRMSLRNVVD